MRGLYLNVSKSGLSLSVTFLLGLLRYTLNFGRNKRKRAIGIPGTGLSWMKETKNKENEVREITNMEPLDLCDETEYFYEAVDGSPSNQ